MTALVIIKISLSDFTFMRHKGEGFKKFSLVITMPLYNLIGTQFTAS